MSSPVPSEYADTLESIKRLVHRARYVAQRRVNTELLRLYWQIGATIIERQKTAPWGSKVLSRLSEDLRTEFPGVKGFSPANLKYMRRFAEAWPDPAAIGQRPVGQLPWGHVIELLDKLEDVELREWYSAKDVAHGWSRPVLAHQIKTNLHAREGAAPSNFPRALERPDSELAQQITKDPFTLEFLAIDGVDTALADALTNGLDGELSQFRIAVARSVVSQALAVAVRNVHQVHGAIGTTHEHNLHRVTLPALQWRGEFGSPALWEDFLSRAAIAGGRDGAWPMVAEGARVEGAASRYLDIVSGASTL
ncbi:MULTISPECIES: DUF1016 N-terminal domain-containing protein [Rhodococcus]|uniref:DUF1016 N-terminal domain-containing protein n=1 Tax=Rhodococcus TaxID=1827 RepID=UPI0008340810|nr:MULTISPECIES: DUF1016 N-terminal domain-containing protein [Rhodococcus]MCD2119640.1 DUF1016 N-terminal domain-containing protein [Rhodococcus pyridinivorans]MCZ4628497.1 DUF1016 N-terminal domain-containing protein [Rhodococcus pyridinivorans]MCZ4649775.1 DUF1016 N-terminal domain-containing protein [Rhodococcus pyridinivorans]MDJ0484634.1 DUF1016 N-terminal domain-containing protein [Rhodococcus pyridinivorans]MDV7255811.1 DUF1016 N-terminal domain-containing protein [Rhodococcus pyridini